MSETLSPKRMDEAVERAEAHTQAVQEHIARQKAQRMALEASRIARLEKPEMTKEQMQVRIKLLSEEIEANEKENSLMQAELSTLFMKFHAK